MVSAVVSTPSRVLGSRSRKLSSTSRAVPGRAERSHGVKSRLSITPATSKTSRSPCTAITIRAATSLTARVFQNSASPRSVGPLVRSRATRTAWRNVLTPSSGFQVSPPSSPGSRTSTRPRLWRHGAVASTTSRLTLVTTSAPCQRRMAGITSDDVLPPWVGPTINSELLDARVTRPPSETPRHVRRPSGGRSFTIFGGPHPVVGVDGADVSPVGRHPHDGTVRTVTNEGDTLGQLAQVALFEPAQPEGDRHLVGLVDRLAKEPAGLALAQETARPLPLSAAVVARRDDVAPSVQHQHVAESARASELPRSAQPSQGVLVTQLGPRFVEHEIAELCAHTGHLLDRRERTQHRDAKGLRRPLRGDVHDH